MMDQFSYQLRNIHSRVYLGTGTFRGVIRGDIRANHGWGTPYELATQPDSTDFVPHRGWRRHRRCFRLEENGEILLEAYGYPGPPRRRTTANERLTGDFFLVLEGVGKDRTYVPFREGKIIEDRAQWPFVSGRRAFSSGEHRDRAPVTVEPETATGNARCPACDVVFSVCKRRSWDGARHRCGQPLVLHHAGQPLPADLAAHLARFDQGITVAPDLTTGSVKCPRCSDTFVIRDGHVWDGQRHSCGQQLVLLRDGEVLPVNRELQETTFRPPLDLSRVEELSRPILARMEAPKEGTIASGACPNCGGEGQLRICSARIVLCFGCYFALPRHAWGA